MTEGIAGMTETIAIAALPDDNSLKLPLFD
jgi:hypothetical protein